MTTSEILQQLAELGTEQTRKTFANHGAPGNFYGVKVGDLKTIQKKIKKNHELSLELYDTGNSDAMYLAGLIADEKQITKEQLQDWLHKAPWHMISEYTVPWLAAESRFGLELGLEWIESAEPPIAAAGWATLASLAGITPDEKLPVKTFSNLLERVEKQIHNAPNRVRYTMNNFVIAVGSAMAELTEKAKLVASNIGVVQVNVGNTACKVPFAPDYIAKVEQMGRLGKKKKMARC